MSRYQDVERMTFETEDGVEIAYQRRRFPPIPPADPRSPRAAVRPGERLDLVAARLLGDPLQYWRLCDANGALDPFDLIDERGRDLLVSSPVPGAEEE